MGLRYYTPSCNIRSKSLACRHIQSRALRGQTLAEYALILAFISVVAISVLINLGNTIRSTFSKINSQLEVAQSSH